MSPPDPTFRPIFVVGCERSGTTMTAVILDRHPQLAMTPETFFFQKVVPKQFRKHPSPPTTHDLALKSFADWFMTRDLHLDPEKLRARFLQYPPTYPNLFRAVMEEFAANHHKPFAGEKTPFHLWQVPMLIQWFPNARIIGLVRDGRDVCLSILKMPWTTHKILRLHAHKWVGTVKTELKYQQQFPQHFKLVKYEDLLQNPQQKLNEINAFLNLPQDPNQLNPGQNTEVVITRALGYKADALSELDPSRIANWRTKASPEQLNIMNTTMNDMLKKMNYPDPETKSLSLTQRISHATANFACSFGLHRLYYNLILRKRAIRARQLEEKKLAQQPTP